MSKTIDQFDGKFAFLSNFYAAHFDWDGRRWPTVEHAFQAAKCMNDAEKEVIHGAHSPKDAKTLGRKVALRPDWSDIKIDLMDEIIYCKFDQNPDLRERLLATRNATLVEGNRWHDNFWGDCFCPKCIGRLGRNNLGRILMDIREQLGNRNRI